MELNELFAYDNHLASFRFFASAMTCLILLILLVSRMISSRKQP